MTDRMHVQTVGAPDPELKNSAIADEGDDEFEVIKLESPGSPACYFNSTSFAHGKYVCSGDTLLRCDRGVWKREGTCDPDNP